MIVFFGHGDDAPLRRARDQAAAADLPHVMLDQCRLDRDELLVEVGPGGFGGRLQSCGAELPLAAITAVYARPLAVPPERDPLAAARGAQLNDAFLEWLDEAPCLVVGRPRTMRSNASKPYQLQLIAEAGFAVPETLVTNRPEEVLAFRDRHRRIIYKSISGIRSIVCELGEEDLPRLDRVRDLPTQFQAYVEGVDVRAHVVGDRVFAAEIVSDATDYRYAHRDGRSVQLRAATLPETVERRCLTLAAALELPFCGIDLRRTAGGEHVCFEVNPMPGYSYFEQETGLPIASALVELLAAAGGTVSRWSRSATT